MRATSTLDLSAYTDVTYKSTHMMQSV